ncbi:MAG: hypothetical protein AB7G13_11580 [Lautropia sp.]
MTHDQTGLSEEEVENIAFEHFEDGMQFGMHVDVFKKCVRAAAKAALAHESEVRAAGGAEPTDAAITNFVMSYDETNHPFREDRDGCSYVFDPPERLYTFVRAALRRFAAPAETRGGQDELSRDIAKAQAVLASLPPEIRASIRLEGADRRTPETVAAARAVDRMDSLLDPERGEKAERRRREMSDKYEPLRYMIRQGYTCVAWAVDENSGSKLIASLLEEHDALVAALREAREAIVHYAACATECQRMLPERDADLAKIDAALRAAGERS